MPKQSQRWKALEKATAEALGGRRIRRRWDLFESAPDVVVTDSGIIAECKTRKRFSHHGLLEEARRKYAQNGETVILVTKAEKQVGAYATVPLDFFAALLNQARARMPANEITPKEVQTPDPTGESAVQRHTGGEMNG